MFYGRRKPYTKIGISRKPCPRCGKPSVHQWQACANNNLYVPICLDCDIEINRMVLEFLKIPNADKMIEKYKQEQNA